jgi:hypothetical protein
VGSKGQEESSTWQPGPEEAKPGSAVSGERLESEKRGGQIWGAGTHRE